MIIITGTPGTGKTSVARELKKMGFKVVNFERRVRECNLIVGYDKKRNSKIVDEDRISECFKDLGRDEVVESHLSHFIDPKYVITSIVLITDPKVLIDRLKKRGWKKEKIEENVEAEIMQVCLNEAIERGHRPIIIDTTNGDFKRVARIIKFNHMLNILEKKYEIKIEIGNPFKTLIRCILSQRTKDETTDAESKKLFSKFKNAKELANAKVSDIDKTISKVGFHEMKARCIKEIAKITKGRIPRDRNLLIKLPCVGKKTADITLSYGFGLPVIAIDTHVSVISNRWGIKGDYDKMQKELHEIFPEDRRLIVNKLLVKFGKEICRKQRPKCNICPVKRWCKYYERNNPGDS